MNSRIKTSLVCGVASVASLLSATRPNIIFILVDDLGLGDLSYQKTPDVKTPNIDKFFNEGLVLNNFYANSNVSTPSRAALLTGRFPNMVGTPGVIRPNIENSFGYFLPSAITLPVILKKGGYETGLIGKWHLGFEVPNLPNLRGFDYFKGFLGDMMDDYYSHLRFGKSYMYLNQTPITEKGHATDLFTDWAIDYVKKDRTKPYFLYLAYNAPHSPLQPPTEWEERVKTREKGITAKRAKLLGLIEHLDNNIGRLYAALESSNQLDNTMIFFTSDNGGDKGSDANCGHTRGYKGDMYEGGLRVPFSVYYKGKILHREVDDFVVLMDMFPTICDYLDIPVTHKIDGISVKSLLEGKDMNTENRYTFWVRTEGGEFMSKSQHAIRYNGYKLVQNKPFEEQSFFYLNNDSLEALPLKKEGAIYQQMIKAGTEHFRMSGAIPSQKLTE